MCLFTNHSCYSACIIVPLWSPILSSQPHKVTIWGTHVMASVWDIKITEALLILCLAYYVMKRVRHCWNLGIMAFTYRDLGCTFHECILHIFCNGWMDRRDAFHAILCLYCCVTDRTKLSTKCTGLWVLQLLILEVRTSNSFLCSGMHKLTS